MVLLVLTTSALAFCLFSIALAPVGRKIDVKEKRLDFISQKKKDAFDELDLSLYKRFVAPALSRMTEYLSKRKYRNKADSARKTALVKDLRYAGIRMSAEEYSVLKNALATPVLLAAIFTSLMIKTADIVRFLIFAVGIILWILLPRYYLAARVKSRQDKIRCQLPEVLDLLCVSIEAGLGFDAALLKISEKMDGPLIDELMILYREIQMGKVRKDALKDFGECSSVPEVKTFASAIIQADKLGIPIKNMLKTHADQLRTARRQRAEEKGMKSPIKMMLPMIVFILPVLFIILLGPVVIQIIAEFKK
jgi:tight adherence protein C